MKKTNNKMKKKALIFGVLGQDGSYLAKYLSKTKYKIYGTTRDKKNSILNHKKLNIIKKVQLIQINPVNKKKVFDLILKIMPHEIYYLSGVSSISESDKNPKDTFASIVSGTINVLESVRLIKKPIKVFFAGSTECYGNLNDHRNSFNEKSNFNPTNFYSIAKSSSFFIVKKYRENFNLWCCTGILSNHESCLRSSKYISKKIIEGVKEIVNGSRKKLVMGNIEVSRDWGWAPEYVEAFWKMLNQDKPRDYIIATGQTNSLKDFVDLVFSYYGLNWKDYVEFSNIFKRKVDIKFTKFNTKLINKNLKWKAKIKIDKIVTKMIKNEYQVSSS